MPSGPRSRNPAFLRSVSHFSRGVIESVQRGDADAIRSLHDRLIFSKDNAGNTLLHYAVLHGQLASVQALLERGALTEAVNHNSLTPLVAVFRASQFGGGSAKYRGDVVRHREAIARALIDAGASLASTEREVVGGRPQYHPVAEAVHRVSFPFLKQMIEGGADISDYRVLHHAAHQIGIHGDEWARELLRRGVHVDLPDLYGNTVLMRAAQNGDEAGVRFLLRHHANVRADNKEGQEPIHFAALSGNVATIRLLKNNGAKRKIADANRYTPFHMAVATGNLDAANMLFFPGAQNRITKNKESPLHSALQTSKLPLVQFLLDKEAQLDVPDKFGQYPVHIAVRDPKLLRMLLEKGANVNVKESSGQTPLHFAAASGLDESAKLLLDAGATVDERDDYGQTPFHQVITNLRHRGDAAIPTADVLLAHGADPTIDLEGKNPLRFATEPLKTHLKMKLDIGR